MATQTQQRAASTGPELLLPRLARWCAETVSQLSLETLAEAPHPELQGALAQFERQFCYPLGSNKSFYISHGADYGRFFRSIGEARTFLVRDQGTVVGALSGAITPLRTPHEEVAAIYIGDLKVAQPYREGGTLPLLMISLAEFAYPRVERAFGVVMHGSARTPDQYTGRLGTPKFEKLADIDVVRMTRTSTLQRSDDVRTCTLPAVEAEFVRLCPDSVRMPLGTPALRSSVQATGLLVGDGSTRACGVLEDTKSAKRLFTTDGEELCSMHLSQFAYADTKSGAALLCEALNRSAQHGIQSVFFSVPAGGQEALYEELREQGIELSISGASVYGCGLPSNLRWHVSTAQI